MLDFSPSLNGEAGQTLLGVSREMEDAHLTPLCWPTYLLDKKKKNKTVIPIFWHVPGRSVFLSSNSWLSKTDSWAAHVGLSLRGAGEHLALCMRVTYGEVSLSRCWAGSRTSSLKITQEEMEAELLACGFVAEVHLAVYWIGT